MVVFKTGLRYGKVFEISDQAFKMATNNMLRDGIK